MGLQRFGLDLATEEQQYVFQFHEKWKLQYFVLFYFICNPLLLSPMCLYIYICIYMCMCVYIYVYVCNERERW